MVTLIENQTQWDALAAAVNAYKEVVNADSAYGTVAKFGEELFAATKKLETTFKTVIWVDVSGCVTWTEDFPEHRVKVFISSPGGDVRSRLELLVERHDVVLYSQTNTVTRKTGVEKTHNVTVIFE